MLTMYMKVQGYRQSIFIDKYFFILIVIMNIFFWFLVLCWLLFICITKSKWVVDKEAVQLLTDGQDLAIYYIKESRKFINDLNKTKKYGDKEKERMEIMIENLSSQFNKYRGQSVLIMDSLLETIDSLRLIQKK